jgi:hypothetical protein
MFETNIELIKEGYDVVNIVDSYTPDTDDAIAAGKRMVMDRFAEFGITPTLKDISYRNFQTTKAEHNSELEAVKRPK